MYALDANSITGHKAAVRFPTEHLAALIKPYLINSDKRGEKDRRSKSGRIGKKIHPRLRFLKKRESERERLH